MGRITRSSQVLYEEMDRLLATMHRSPRDAEKRKTLESILADAGRERGAYMNASFVWPLDFILMTAAAYDAARLRALEERIEALASRMDEQRRRGAQARP